jgi:hypothetical protein
MISNNELERIWKEAVVALFKVLSQALPGGTKENHRNLRIVSVPAEIQMDTSHIQVRSIAAWANFLTPSLWT